MSSSSAEEPRPRKGKTQPRLFTKPLRELTPETSLGFEATKFAEEILGRPLHPWQKWLLVHSLELKPGSFTSDEFPTLRFRTVVILVARQNGKSYYMSTRLLWRMFMWDGPEPEAPLILGTAHKLSAATEILDLSVKALTRSEYLAGQILRRSRTNGDEHVELVNGARYKVEASSDDGGRGLSVTDLGFDELRQQREWSAWAAMSNTTNAIHSAQVVAVSNAGEAKSDVLRGLRDKGLEELKAFEAKVSSGAMSVEEYAAAHDTSLGLFEWSAPEDCSIWDRDGWASSNPSMGYPGGPREETIAAAASLVGQAGKGMPEHKYRTEVLCQWVTVAAESVWDQDLVEAVFSYEDHAEIDPASPIVLAVDVSHDRRTSHMVIAGWRSDGKAQVEHIERRPGTEWVPNHLAHMLTFKPDALVLQGRGAPASTLLSVLEGEGLEVTRVEGGALGASAGRFYDRVVTGKVKAPFDAEALKLAMMETRTKNLGDVFVFDRNKSPVDVAPLNAAAFAVWALEELENKPAPAKSAYAQESFGGWDLKAEAHDEFESAESDEERWWL